VKQLLMNKNGGQSEFWGRHLGTLQKNSGIGQPTKFYICGHFEVHSGSSKGEVYLAIFGNVDLVSWECKYGMWA
jgi:hypothetical protein